MVDREYGESITVGEGGVANIQEAFDVAYEHKNVKNIYIEEGKDIYSEELTLIRKTGSQPLNIIGKGAKLSGPINIINEDACSLEGEIKGEYPKISLDGIYFKNTMHGHGEPALTACAVDMDLKDLVIDGFYISAIFDTNQTGYGKLNMENIEIKNVEGYFETCNYDITMNKLNYHNNMEGLNISNCMEDNKLSELTIDNSSFTDNVFSFSSIIDGENIYGTINNSNIKNNTTDSTILDISNDCEKDRGKFTVKETNIDMNNDAREMFSSAPLLDFYNLDLDIQDISLVDNLNGFIDIEEGAFILKNIDYKNNFKNNLDFGIDVGNHDEIRKGLVENINISGNKSLSSFMNDFAGVDLNINKVNINLPLLEEFYLDLDTNFDISDINFIGAGGFYLDAGYYGDQKKHKNTIRDVDFKFNNFGSDNYETYFSCDFGEDIYDIQNVRIDYAEGTENEGGEVSFAGSTPYLKNIELKNIGSIEFYDLKESLNEYLVEDLRIFNDPSKDEYDCDGACPIYIDTAEDKVDVKLKNIKVDGGSYDSLLSGYDINNVDVYQLHFKNLEVYDYLDIHYAKNFNIINSTITNIEPKDEYKEIYTGHSNINIFNSIFDLDIEEFVGDNSKLTFKNSIIPKDYTKLEEIEEVAVSIDDTNIIGKALLDKNFVPKKKEDKEKDQEGLIEVIDKGDNKYIEKIDKDIRGKERIYNNIVDMGAYEYYVEEIEPPVQPPVDPPTMPEPPINPPTIKPTPPSETGENKAYLKGFPDGTVRLYDNLTKQDAAIIFYRLIDDKIIKENYSEEVPFKDIPKNYWARKYIGTLYKIGMIDGDTKGNFNPQKEITRAELAKMIDIFEALKEVEAKKFTDVKGHWAEEYIYTAVSKGWLKGYTDGSFKPDRKMTRMEFITAVNRVFSRDTKLENMILDGIKEFKDVKQEGWYYRDLIEASNSYKYKVEKGEKIWTKIIN